MSVLVDRDILTAMDLGSIVIEPFDRRCLGTNSYDVHLSPTMMVYDRLDPEPLDVRSRRATEVVRIPDEGVVLEPGELYLASTVEWTESHAHLPMLNGRSSLGRYGLSIHVTAGTGDVGFCGHWTMELFVVRRLRLYAGIPIGQILWLEASGVPDVTYSEKRSAKYRNAGPDPQPSKIHEELSSESGVDRG